MRNVIKMQLILSNFAKLCYFQQMGFCRCPVATNKWWASQENPLSWRPPRIDQGSSISCQISQNVRRVHKRRPTISSTTSTRPTRDGAHHIERASQRYPLSEHFLAIFPLPPLHPTFNTHLLNTYAVQTASLS